MTDTDKTRCSKVQPAFPGGELKSDEEHYPPLVVMMALKLWGGRKSIPMTDLLWALRWDGMNGCYCFTWAGMFVGVETDGHIHT